MLYAGSKMYLAKLDFISIAFNAGDQRNKYSANVLYIVISSHP